MGRRLRAEGHRSGNFLTEPFFMNNNVRRFLLGLRNRHYLFVDIILVALAPFVALFLRVDHDYWRYWESVSLYAIIVVVWKPLVFKATGLYKRYWPYASVDSMIAVVNAGAITLVLEVGGYFWILAPLGFLNLTFPRTIPFLSSGLAFAFVAGFRLAVRVLFDLERRRRTSGQKSVNTLVVGAGVA